MNVLFSVKVFVLDLCFSLNEDMEYNFELFIFIFFIDIGIGLFFV